MTSTHPDTESLEHDVTMALPRQWTTRHHPTPGVLLVSRARSVPASGLRPELVVRSQPIEDDAETWRLRTTTALAEQCVGLEIEDDDVFDLNGQTVTYRRFAHFAGAVDVLCEEWAWLVDGVAITLTGSIAREDYLDYGDVFDQVAATVEIVTRPAR